jgi:hypothetical protein
VKCVQWKWHDEVSDSIVGHVLLWLWDGDSSGTQEGDRLPLEAGTRGLVRDSRPRRLSACAESSIDCNCVNWRERHRINCNQVL